jgi:hypothetical protein
MEGLLEKLKALAADKSSTEQEMAALEANFFAIRDE